MHFNLQYFFENLSIVEPEPSCGSKRFSFKTEEPVTTVKTVTVTLTVPEAEIYARALSLGAAHYFGKSASLSTHKENINTANEMQKHFCFLMAEIEGEQE